jgi:hypothetical protein
VAERREHRGRVSDARPILGGVLPSVNTTESWVEWVRRELADGRDPGDVAGSLPDDAIRDALRALIAHFRPVRTYETNPSGVQATRSPKWAGVAFAVASGDVFDHPVRVGEHVLPFGDLTQGHLAFLAKEQQRRAEAFVRLGLLLRERGRTTVRQLPREEVGDIMASVRLEAPPVHEIEAGIDA